MVEADALAEAMADFAAAVGAAVERVRDALRFLETRAQDQSASLRAFQRWLVRSGVVAPRRRSGRRRRRKHPTARRRGLRT